MSKLDDAINKVVGRKRDPSGVAAARPLAVDLRDDPVEGGRELLEAGVDMRDFVVDPEDKIELGMKTLEQDQRKVIAAGMVEDMNVNDVLAPEIRKYLRLRQELKDTETELAKVSLSQQRHKIVLALMHDPMVDTWLGPEGGNAQPYPLKRPEHVLGERLCVMAMMLAADVRWTHPDGSKEVPSWDERLALVKQMLKAPPYLWTRQVYEIALHGELPKHTVAETVLPHPMWWAEAEKETMSKRQDGDDLALVGQFLAPSPRGMHYYEFWLDIDSHGPDPRADQEPGSSTHLFVEQGFMPYGAVWPDHFNIADPGGGGGMLLRQLAFLASPYTAYDAETAPRPVRREYARRNRKEPPRVRFITLRRPQHPAAAASGEHHTREWSRQWLVRAHYRAQWYPSLQAHKVIWIDSFMKGPADKPFVPPVYKVSR